MKFFYIVWMRGSDAGLCAKMPHRNIFALLAVWGKVWFER
ncbi:hypothetical protein CEV31_1739 [Brucella thiophenivorans]|uniref:Uncharacterized protein n=1 Tax=Brucella thiophenivorans TaxID=571255 RepID=A0A256FZP2_9HYPH|nr:hypothetical protein CEV31_1739 [Brucella thiophenivorans]